MFLFLFIFFGNFSFADSTIYFQIRDRHVAFLEIKSKEILISADCKNPTGKLKCEAWTATRTARLVKNEKFLFGKSMASTICRKQFKAKIVLGIDEKGNENTFCEFADHSMLDHQSLYYFAKQNDSP